MNPSPYDLALLDALHEASHAVAVVLLGGTVETVSADSTQRAAACPLGDWEAAVVAMAGAVGVRLHGPAVRSLSRGPSEQDNAVADTVLERLGLTPAHKRRASEQAEALLRPQGRTIRRVANALLERERLSGAEVEAIMGRKPVDDAQAPPVVDAQPEAANPTEPLRVVARSWALKVGGFCATVAPSSSAPPGLGDLEAVAPTREGALDSLGRMLARVHGGPVSLTDVDLDAEDDAA